MTSDPSPYEEQLIRKDLTNLYLLHAVMKEARQRMDDSFNVGYFDSVEDSGYWAKGLLIQARKILEVDPINGWCVRHLQDSLQLVSQASLMRVRVNKEYAFTGKLPPAGQNTARRASYMQGQLRGVEELPRDLDGNPMLTGVELFITWGLQQDGSFELIAQKPLGPGTFRSGAPVSMAIPIATTPEAFRFPSTASEAPLFVSDEIQIKQQEDTNIVSDAQHDNGNE